MHSMDLASPIIPSRHRGLPQPRGTGWLSRCRRTASHRTRTLRKWRPLSPRANCRACADAKPMATPRPDDVAAKVGTYPFGFLSLRLAAGLSTLPVGPQFVKRARCVRDTEPGIGPFIGARRVGGCDRDALVSARVIGRSAAVLSRIGIARPAVAPFTKLWTDSRKGGIHLRSIASADTRRIGCGTR
jgi:hypothetical protein